MQASWHNELQQAEVAFRHAALEAGVGLPALDSCRTLPRPAEGAWGAVALRDLPRPREPSPRDKSAYRARLSVGLFPPAEQMVARLREHDVQALAMAAAGRPLIVMSTPPGIFVPLLKLALPSARKSVIVNLKMRQGEFCMVVATGGLLRDETVRGVVELVRRVLELALPGHVRVEDFYLQKCAVRTYDQDIVSRAVAAGALPSAKVLLLRVTPHAASGATTSRRHGGRTAILDVRGAAEGSALFKAGGKIMITGGTNNGFAVVTQALDALLEPFLAERVRARTRALHEELMQAAWHPRRVLALGGPAWLDAA